MAILSNQFIKIDEKKAIIFDWDGTLYNNVPAIKTATQDVLTQFEIDHDVDEAVSEFLDLMEKIDTSPSVPRGSKLPKGSSTIKMFAELPVYNSLRSRIPNKNASPDLCRSPPDSKLLPVESPTSVRIMFN